MRNKLRYTIDEITIDLYTPGGQFMTEDNMEYIGAYHRYITNEIYTGSVWNAKTSMKLVPFVKTKTDNLVYRGLKSNLITKYHTPAATTITITEQQRMASAITRYFMKKTNDTHIFEIDERTYTLWQTKRVDPLVYLATEIIWQIAGPINDETVAGVSILGVRTKNLNQLKLKEATLPGISLKLTNPIELYTDIDFKVPKDINS